MRAIDTNVLIYAEMVTSRHHAVARELLRELAEDARPWAIPWPCVYEYLRVVTHPRVYHPPAPLRVALADLRASAWQDGGRRERHGARGKEESSALTPAPA